jgi:hypothetical protein
VFVVCVGSVCVIDVWSFWYCEVVLDMEVVKVVLTFKMSYIECHSRSICDIVYLVK